MNSRAKRIIITLVVLTIPLVIGLLFTYEVIKIDWISFMEIQPSFRAMEDPRPLPVGSVPVQGAAYLPGPDAPLNPVTANAQSIERGKMFYDLNCALCHGSLAKGDGSLAKPLKRKPPDLTSPHVVALADGDIFMIITNGLAPVPGFKGGMPALRENLSVGDRWDVVNYLRTLQGK
jgi:mono/diheme cytochrome c family protein